MSLRKLFQFARGAKLVQRTGARRYVHSMPRVQQRNKSQPMAYMVAVGTSLVGFWGFGKQKEEAVEPTMDRIEVVTELADLLYERGNYKGAYSALDSHRNSNDVEILWRLSRVLYTMSTTATSVEAKKMILEAYDLISQALSIKEDHWAVNKWMAILLDSKSNLEGMRARVKELYNIKNYMLRAIELNPKDATTCYMVGKLCYEVANLPWYQKELATVVFGEPPKSSFEEALSYFEKAEQIDSGFYSHNLLMLGKTYFKLNNKEKALMYLDMAVKYQAKNSSDIDAIQEAKDLLGNLK